MGLISRALGNARSVEAVGNAASSVAEIFHANETRRMELSAEAHRAALDAHGAEFQYGRGGWFDRLVNGINRLPRPFLALGTMGLFVFAMADPGAFAERMVGLREVPEPLWWLLGAIVSFYFGAREMFYFRSPRGAAMPRMPRGEIARDTAPDAGQDSDAAENPALSAWREDRDS